MKNLLLLALLFICSSSIVAQEAIANSTSQSDSKKGYISFHFGPTFPMADFNDDDLEDNEGALGAGVGIGVGLEYTYPLNESGLGFFVGLDVNLNWLKSDVRDDIEDMFDGFVDEDDITFNKYFNIPLSAGLNYTFKADEKFSIYGNFGLAANFLKITNFTVEYDGEEIVTEYDLSTKIGVKVGGGVILNNKTFISLNYFGIGKQDINTTTDDPFDGNDFDTDWKSQINYLTLTIGFKL